MATDKNRFQGMHDLSQLGGGDAEVDVAVQEIKRDLEGWREVLLPLASLLKWDLPYFPAVIIGITTFLFSIVWYTDMSTLTTISLFCLIVGVADYLVPFFGPSITGYKSWTGEEESKFTDICEKIACIQQDLIDCWRGLAVMRRDNPKLFFLVVMGLLSTTAWIGNLIDNLFLTYIFVNFLLLLPGIRQHELANRYFHPLMKAIDYLKAGASKIKTS